MVRKKRREHNSVVMRMCGYLALVVLLRAEGPLLLFVLITGLLIGLSGSASSTPSAGIDVSTCIAIHQNSLEGK